MCYRIAAWWWLVAMNSIHSIFPWKYWVANVWLPSIWHFPMKILGCIHHPNWRTHIFSEGWPNHQPEKHQNKIWIQLSRELDGDGDGERTIHGWSWIQPKQIGIYMDFLMSKKYWTTRAARDLSISMHQFFLGFTQHFDWIVMTCYDSLWDQRLTQHYGSTGMHPFISRYFIPKKIIPQAYLAKTCRFRQFCVNESICKSRPIAVSVGWHPSFGCRAPLTLPDPWLRCSCRRGPVNWNSQRGRKILHLIWMIFLWMII